MTLQTFVQGNNTNNILQYENKTRNNFVKSYAWFPILYHRTHTGSA